MRAFLLILAFTAPALAQEFPSRAASEFLDPERGAAESELVTRALASNPSLLAERQQVAEARGDVEQARLRRNPSLLVSGLKEVNGADNRVNLGGSLPLELFGRRARRTEVAGDREEVSEKSVADRERLLTGAVRTRFGQALAAVRDLSVLEQLLAVNRDFLRLMDDRVREGSTAPLDADETRVEVNRIESLRIDDQAKAEVALLALREAVGIDPEEPLRLKGALELEPRAYDRTRLFELAAAHRPDLQVQQANGLLAQSELREDRAAGKPDASVFGAYERPSSGFAQLALDPSGVLRPIRQTFNYATFGLNIALPAFDRREGAIAADTAAIHAADREVEAANLQLRSEVAQGLARFSGAQARVQVYRDGVRGQAARNLDVVRQTYTYGRTTLLDVIAEQRRYIDVETGYTGILLDAYTARAALEQAAGTDLP